MLDAKTEVVVGSRFGRLTVTALPLRVCNTERCPCDCACGKRVEVLIASLRYGKTKSCGCLRNEALSQRRLLHGATKLEKSDPIRRTFNIWSSLRGRCNNPKNSRYESYGARGISCALRWDLFENFLEDMGACPEGYSIEREDNNGDYTKENCHWLPRGKQAQNKQGTIRIRYQNQDWCLKRLCEYLQRPYLKTYKRYVMRGWDLARALEITLENKDELMRIE